MVQVLAMTRGYAFHDVLTVADVIDGAHEHPNHEEEDFCDSEFDDYCCSRLMGHTGPHVAGIGPDTIAAVWESC